MQTLSLPAKARVATSSSAWLCSLGLQSGLDSLCALSRFRLMPDDKEFTFRTLPVLHWLLLWHG